MQDLFQNYVSDLLKLRDAFHAELTVQAQELSKAMGNYSRHSEAALASFMESVSTRGAELEAAAAERLNQFRGLPANGGPPDVSDRPLADTPTNVDQVKIVAAAERAVADSLRVENDGDRKVRSGPPIALVNRGRGLEAVSGEARVIAREVAPAFSLRQP